MIRDKVTVLEGILRIENIDDYQELNAVIQPAAEQVIRDAVGPEWVDAHEDDATVIQLFCILVATWFGRPEAFGELTPGANFLLTQLQARAMGGDADG